MALKDRQKAALAALQERLLSAPGLQLRAVYLGMPGNITPDCVVITESPDGGLVETRREQWREIEWDLHVSIYVGEARLEEAQQRARDLRADVLDALGGDITLGGTVAYSYWRGPFRVTALRFGGDDQATTYVGATGILTLVIKEGFGYA